MMPQTWKQWLVLGLIFLLGVATGVSLTVGFGPHFTHPPGARQMRDRMLMNLTHRLNLTPEQQAKVQPILADLATQMQAVHRDEIGRVAQIMDKANHDISALLTPEQQTEMAALVKEMEKERDRMAPGHMRPWMQPGMEPGPMPPPPGPGPALPPPGMTNAPTAGQ